MTYDFDDETRLPMFAVEPTTGGGVDDAMSRGPMAESPEDEEEPDSADPEEEKAEHA